MKIYPNDLCPCGSGKKYKYCCKNKKQFVCDFDISNSIYSKNAMEEIREPTVQCYNEEIKSLRKYPLETIPIIGNGRLNDELKLTEFCISKIEQAYAIKLLGERSNLQRAAYELQNASIPKCANVFYAWRKGIINRYSGKVCTAELTSYCYGMENCKKNLPILVLPDVNNITTFYEDIFQQFPVKQDMKYAIPFNDFVIKVSDTNNKSVFVVVHKKNTYYELVGLTSTSNDNSNSNLDFIALNSNAEMILQYQMGIIHEGVCQYKEYSAPCIKVPFDYLNNIKIATNSSSCYITSAYQWWDDMAIEFSAGTKDVVNDLKMPCTDILILHIWLHALALYYTLLNSQRVEYIKQNNKTFLKQSNLSHTIHNASNKCIIDLGKTKKIYVYNSDAEKENICKKYHIFNTIRRGHFRKYSNGKIIYIPPTTVIYSEEHLANDAHEKEYENFYRNSEDFLREKSYLEADVRDMLSSHNIAYKREVSSSVFSWIGRKRLDFYLPDKKIAIECQGVQHFYPYGTKDTDFEARKQRDIDKYNECVSHGVTLIYYVSPNIPIPPDMLDKYLFVTDLDDLYDLIK